MASRKVTLYINGDAIDLQLPVENTLAQIEGFIRSPEGRQQLQDYFGKQLNIHPSDKLTFHYNKESAQESLKEYRINQFNPNKKTIFFVNIEKNGPNNPPPFVSGPIEMPQVQPVQGMFNGLQPPMGNQQQPNVNKSNKLITSSENMNGPKMFMFQIMGDIERIRSIEISPTQTLDEMERLIFEGKKFSKVTYFTSDGTQLQVPPTKTTVKVRDTELWRVSGLIMVHNDHNAA